MDRKSFALKIDHEISRNYTHQPRQDSSEWGQTVILILPEGSRALQLAFLDR